MRVVAIGAHNSDGSSDICGLLLLPPTVATGYMTSDDRCYCGARGMHPVSTSPHSSDGSSDISRPLLLPPTVVMGYVTVDIVGHVAHAQLLLAPTVAMGILTSVTRRYWPP
jgi:hypothetical protein